MRLRDTTSARTWLKQFSDEDRIAAQMLLDAIQITTSDQIKSDIEAAIHELIEQSKNVFYIAPIVSREDVLKYLELGPKDDRQLEMFDDYDPLNLIGKDAGSENYLALVARDVRKKFRKQAAFDGSTEAFKSVEDLQSQVEFVFIVDNSMSGSQVAFFLNSFWKSARVFSLLEKRKTSVQVHLVCWGATRQVIEMLDSAPEYLKVNRTIVSEVPTVHSCFPPGEALDAVMHLVQKFPKAASGLGTGKRGLGYMDTGALFLPLGSSAPNNMPDLLIRSARAKTQGAYVALFADRHIPPEVKALPATSSPIPVRNVDEYNEKLRKKKLVTAAKVANSGSSKEWAMVLLMALNYTPPEIRSELGLSYIDSKRILGTFRSIGWATSAFTLTELGHRSLREFGSKENYSEYMRGLRYVRAEVDGERGAYYPQSVRGVK